MKDLFSEQSSNYARYRPTYPAALFDELRKLTPDTNLAWDCATGNGQVALQLSPIFKQVKATDISVQQLMQAFPAPNIQYTRQKAESTDFPESCFDLICVGQAVHWFNFPLFYTEVKRVLKKDGIIAIFGYALVRSNNATNVVIDKLYHEILGSFWDKERRYLEEEYMTIPFPFQEIEIAQPAMSQRWTLNRLIGYLNTWSAVKHYQKTEGHNPVTRIAKDLEKSFGEIGEVNFPILLRVGKHG